MQGAPGDLYINLHVLAHKFFHRQGDDIVMRLPVKLSQALLGDTADVEKIDGAIGLKIPEGTQSHTVFKMRNKGMPRLHGHGYGDELVKVKVVVPERLTKKQQEIIEELADELGEEVKPPKSFFKKIREAF